MFFRLPASIKPPMLCAEGFKKIVIGSVGPVCTQVLRQFGIEPDIEPVHPKMGSLIAEVAVRARDVLAKKSS